MAGSSNFFDHFAVSNTVLQERLGRSASMINRNSAVFGQQTRSLVQMLNYGLDSITARAASHLLNMDVLHSNDSYLLKLTEGLLLNSIESITPPKINASAPFEFWSEYTYTKWGSIGTVSLMDGTTANLVIYNLDVIGNVEGTERGIEYRVLYCAGNFVNQSIDAGFEWYAPGTFAPIYISETYKSIWSESVEVRIELEGELKSALDTIVCWSLDELLSVPDNSYAVLMQHTPRGMTLTLGDGEIFGSGYNNDNTHIRRIIVTYIKCDSLDTPNNATIQFNSDITEIFRNGHSVSVLSPLDTGDTPDDLRSRAISEFFAAGKITSERDLVTEVNKIPFVKSCFARREYNWPISTTASMLLEGYYDYRYSRGDTPNRRMYIKYKYDPAVTYMPGDMVVYDTTLYVCKLQTSAIPNNKRAWEKFIDLESARNIGSLYNQYYPTANIYDNATIVLSGLIMQNRRYWSQYSSYDMGDVVYHKGTNKLWLALKRGGEIIEPGSEDDKSIYDDDRFWVTYEDAKVLDSDNTGVSLNLIKFNEYVPLTQAIFESEIKGYFNIANKLGFTSVVVESLNTIGVTVSVTYTAPVTMQSNVRKTVEDYICYQVGKTLEVDRLNAMLTSSYNLTAVYVEITITNQANSGVTIVLPPATYVPPSMLTLELHEYIGRK